MHNLLRYTYLNKQPYETFRPIDFIQGIDPSYYQISDYGNVFSTRKNEIIFGGIDTGGYYFILLYTGGFHINISIHRLVALAFVSIPERLSNIPISQLKVCHLDTNKNNNNASNLEWMTSGENLQHAYANGLIDLSTRVGEKVARSKLTTEQVKYICEYLEKEIDYKTILENIGLDPCVSNRKMISQIKQRKNWVHISKNYNF